MPSILQLPAKTMLEHEIHNLIETIRAKKLHSKSTDPNVIPLETPRDYKVFNFVSRSASRSESTPKLAEPQLSIDFTNLHDTQKDTHMVVNRNFLKSRPRSSRTSRSADLEVPNMSLRPSTSASTRSSFSVHSAPDVLEPIKVRHFFFLFFSCG